MKTDIWMPIYIGDYLADTQHLSAEKHGIYFLLMMHYWKHGPLDDDIDDLACVARSTEDKTEKILKKFFYKNGGQWHQKRLDKEREAAESRRETARENGRKGGRPPKNPQETHGLSEGIPDANPTHNPQKTSSPSPLSLSTQLSSVKETRKRFTPPTFEEAKAYCEEKGVNPEKWYNYYTSNGWKVGKNKMADWKAAVRTWINNDKPRQQRAYGVGGQELKEL